MEQAWEAVEDRQLHLAEKLSHRASVQGLVNPRIWFDHGRILELCGRVEEAEKAFRTAVSLAPHAEALESLARLEASSAKTGGERDRDQLDETASRPAPTPCSFTELTERIDWSAVDAQLTATGCAPLPGLLSNSQCQELIALYRADDLFEHDVARNDESGDSTYRYCTRPLPDLVQTLRYETYGRAALIANRWQELLARTERFPPVLEQFLEHCQRAGQYRTTPHLAHYRAGGFDDLHTDTAAKVIFPLQLEVTLGPGTSPDGGGELILADHRPGRKRRQTEVPMAAGDGVLYCTRERLVRIAGVNGSQPVLHGVAAVVRMERYVLRVPFHEHG